MLGRQSGWLVVIAAAAALSLGACGGRKPQPQPDAGVDAGEVEDAGHDAGQLLEDAGHDAGEDAGTDGGAEPDAGEPDGGEPDAGEPDAGEPDAGCGDQLQVFHSVRDQGIGFPLDWSKCTGGCTEIIAERFTDAAALEAFYQDEIQVSAVPVVNFLIADAIVTYACVCNSFGYELKTHDVVEDACGTLSTLTELLVPGEDCFTQQTFTRPYSTVEVPKSAGGTVQTQETVTVYSCE